MRAATSGLLLALFAAVATGLLGLTEQATRERIADNLEAQRLQQLAQVLPALTGMDLREETVQLADGPLQLVRLHQDGAVRALAIETIAPDGYSGEIRILIGLTAAGSISGVRVLEHRETPGLGDAIELRRSDWILAFDGRSLGDPPAEAWSVRRDGGRFDQFTGATITPRAVVGAVRAVLARYAREREAFLGPALEGDAG